MRVPVEPELDLHTYNPRELQPLLEDYLAEALARGFRRVVIIHGKGRGVLRHRVRSLLARHPHVAAYHDAPSALGSWGATVVHLKPDTEEHQTQPQAASFKDRMLQVSAGIPWIRFGIGMVLGMVLGALILLGR